MYSALFLTEYRVHWPSSTSTSRVPRVPSTSTQKNGTRVVLEYEYCTRVLHHCLQVKSKTHVVLNGWIFGLNFLSNLNKKGKGVETMHFSLSPPPVALLQLSHHRALCCSTVKFCVKIHYFKNSKYSLCFCCDRCATRAKNIRKRITAKGKVTYENWFVSTPRGLKSFFHL